MISDDRIPQYPSDRSRVLGICWGLFAAVWLVSFSNTATVMFGSLLGRVPDPFTMMAFFHFLYTLVVALSVVCGALGILAGWALLAGQRSRRALTLIAGFLSLSDIPLGITLGIYSLVVLLPITARHDSATVVDDRAGDLRGHPSAT